MTSQLDNEIRCTLGGIYLFWNETGKMDMSPDTPEYFTWLAGLRSFHFKGKDGHFTARQEQKGEKTYWYAYRKEKKQQCKKYLGITDRLTIHRLETVATAMQEEIDQLPAPERKPRKKPIPKATLRNQIILLEKTVIEQKKRIEELENELRALKIQKATEGHRQILKNRYKEHTDSRHARHILAVDVGRCDLLSEQEKVTERQFMRKESYKSRSILDQNLPARQKTTRNRQPNTIIASFWLLRFSILLVRMTCFIGHD